ncbi:MAG TPA: hypothetical protein VFC46_14450, partial [Humisphaera sp.]|nr:hypothetical protein [Humisphaera sp.]
AYGRTGDLEGLKDALDKIAAVRVLIFDNRNKHGQGEVVSTKNPASSGTAPPVNPNPAVRHGVPMPPGSVKTALIGGHGGGSFYHLTRNNAAAIGFRYLIGEWGGKAVMKEIGPAFGPRPPQMKAIVREIMAKDGYIAGGLVVDADDTNVVAFKVIFVAFKDGVVNKKDTYTSDWQGAPDSNSPQTLAGNGEIILGTIERRGMNQDAIGLVIIPPGGKIPPPSFVPGTGAKPTPLAN